mmetsp:Transcript_32448/g.59523  ORF Transcript_32448/g.59523 Transcript_32448/m.59523 type:complete len:141 (+) Transcript_32448:76-498(+)
MIRNVPLTDEAPGKSLVEPSGEANHDGPLSDDDDDDDDFIPMGRANADGHHDDSRPRRTNEDMMQRVRAMMESAAEEVEAPQVSRSCVAALESTAPVAASGTHDRVPLVDHQEADDVAPSAMRVNSCPRRSSGRDSCSMS